MNAVFFAIVLVSFLVAAFRQITFAPPTPDAEQPMQGLAAGMIDTAGSSVTLAISLIGVMTLFLGLMKVAEGGGLLVIIARLLRPLMVRLFPDVPAEHPAMGAMIMNFSANVMGLGNAATPFGIRAMQALDSLNQHKGTATNAMVLFLAINTSSVPMLLPNWSPRISQGYNRSIKLINRVHIALSTFSFSLKRGRWNLRP